MDATLVETNKKQALHCYKGFQPYPPFGVWWGIMILALNLNEMMKRQVLARVEKTKQLAVARMKALGFHLIHVAGRVIERARSMRVRIAAGHPSLEMLIGIRKRILELAASPPR